MTLLLFAIISQVPYVFFCNSFISLNILFTFLISLLFLFVLNNLNKITNLSEKILVCIILILVGIVIAILGLFNVIDYGLWGVLMPIVFYLFREKGGLKYSLFILLVFCLVVEKIIISGEFKLNCFIQLFSLIDILILAMYNRKKGNYNFKYLFYAYYPIHFIVLIIISFII